jgi:hypothetical protein
VTFRLHHLLHHDAEDPMGSMCLADLHSGSTAHANVLQCWMIAALLVTLDPARSSELTGSATGGDEPHSPTAELDASHKNYKADGLPQQERSASSHAVNVGPPPPKWFLSA